MSDDAPVTDGNTYTVDGPVHVGPPPSGPDQLSTVDSPNQTDDYDYLVKQIDNLARSNADLHAKVDHLTNGIGAVYQMVDHLVKMLSAVQQVASMMPGGKKIAQAMQAQHGGQKQ